MLKLVEDEEKQQYPDWLDVELWQDFLQHRKEIKAEMTPTAEKRAIMKLDRLISAGGDQVSIIEWSIDKKYLGLFQRKADDDGKPKSQLQQVADELRKANSRRQ